MSDQQQFILPADIRKHIEMLHKEKRNIVFVSGVFDLLHEEHVTFLRKAKAIGDVLFVAIESDVRVRQMKGEGRPIQPQRQRQLQIENLGIAEITCILPDDFSRPEQHRQIIAEVRPKYLAVSSHTAHIDKKRAVVEQFGGELVVVHEHNPEVSTTQLLAEQKNT